MSDTGPGEKLRFNLKEGDFIQAKVTKLGGGSIGVDTSLFANVDSATVAEFNDIGGVHLGSDIYAKVKDIENSSATLVQAERVYQRHHRPGDTIRAQAVEQSTSTTCRAEPDRQRNLDTLYVTGVELGADVEAEIAKIRNGTAIAVPVEFHRKGLMSGLDLFVETTAGSQSVALSKVPDRDGFALLSDLGVDLGLTEPARASCTAKVQICDITKDIVQCEILNYPAELPDSGENIEVDVTKGEEQITTALSEDVTIGIQFNDRVPCTGTAVVELDSTKDGIYHGQITTYVEPNIRVNKTYPAKVYASRDLARLEPGDHRIPVKLEKERNVTGDATVEVVDISRYIYGRVKGKIDQRTTDDGDSSDFDLTNLSKL